MQLTQSHDILDKKYETLIETYSILEFTTNDLESMIIALEEQIQKEQMFTAKLIDRNDQLLKEYKSIQDNLLQLDQDLNEINLQKIRLESEIQINQEEISNLNNVRKTQLANIVSLNNEFIALNNELIIKNDELAANINELNDLIRHSQILEDDISSLQGLTELQFEEIMSLEFTISELNDEIILLEESNSELREKYNSELRILENRDEILKLGNSLKDSIVIVRSDDGLGTGFFVSNNGCIITNSHVTDGSNTITVEIVDGTILTGELLKEGDHTANLYGNIAAQDIALVKVDYNSIPIKFSSSLPTVGEKVVSVGHPGLLGKWVMVTGSFKETNHVNNEYRFTLPAFPGSSGSPIVNMDSELVGLLWGGNLWNPINQNDNTIVWENNLGDLLTKNKDTLAEKSITVESFLANTQCKIN